VFQLARFADATGQRWKYRVLIAAMIAALCISVAFFSLWNGNPAGLRDDITIALYIPICIFWLVWWAAAIRCPSCGIRIGWYQMNRGSASDVATRMAMTGSCPACGFKGE
jgi:hypothetical protein